jgi:hypothetical protein
MDNKSQVAIILRISINTSIKSANSLYGTMLKGQIGSIEFAVNFLVIS